MKYLKISLLIVVLPTLGFSQSPLSMECDFENGMMGWKGDGKIVEDKNFNKVCSLKKTGSDHRQITYTYTLPRNATVQLHFRARAMPGGSGIEFHRKNRKNGGVLFSRVPLPATGEWVDVTQTTSDKKGEGPLECTVFLSLQKGKGEIQLDDFTVTIDASTLPQSHDGNPVIGGAVYRRISDTPRPSKTPRWIDVENSSGVKGALRVSASLAEIRHETDSSRGNAGMTGRLNTFRKFFRVEVNGATPASRPAKMVVRYNIEEDGELWSAEDVVLIDESWSNFVADSEGFEDVFGIDVKSKKKKLVTTSTKYEYPEADIVSAEIVILDDRDSELYLGSWPVPATRPPKLPKHLKPRVYTSVDGKQITATVFKVEDGSVTLLMNGKPYEVALTELSKPDQMFLETIRNDADKKANP